MNFLLIKVRDHSWSAVLNDVRITGDFAKMIHDKFIMSKITENANYKIDNVKDTLIVKSGTLVYGEYNIKMGLEDSNDNDIIIHFESACPLVPDSNDALSINCNVSSDDFGEGKAIGTVEHISGMKDGKMVMRQVIRNVLTFPNQELSN
jgi:hypothetical protein